MLQKKSSTGLSSLHIWCRPPVLTSCNLQERREILARLLKGKLQPFVSGEVDMPGFQAKFTAEAEELASLPFGVPMLHLIGYTPNHNQHCIYS